MVYISGIRSLLTTTLYEKKARGLKTLYPIACNISLNKKEKKKKRGLGLFPKKTS